MNDLNIELRDNQIIITVPREWIGSVGLNDRRDANAIGAALTEVLTKVLGSKPAAAAASKSTDAPSATATTSSKL